MSRNVGVYYEMLAVASLERKGFHIVCRNFTIRGGELDIVAYKNGIVHVVEVRFRHAGGLVQAHETITPRKLMLLRRATIALLGKYPKLRKYPIQFDVCAATERQLVWYWNI